MEWSTFFLLITSCYAAYYTLNILFDLVRARGGHKAADNTAVVYHMSELAGEEEQPIEVEDEYYDEPADYQDEEEWEDEEEFEDDAPLEQAHSLRVEGQGIPLDDFLREAKSHAKSIF
ncbi:hypothetical protein [Pontibacter akesuensis]|uniref:Uncharacterized protein n=1 Tax=Pontibacter akesuensis TaxID=388950 RepID=A0A1I7KPC8_9BACT|nr:hypothetical protein [Pontibacter akesuensis]GHA81694.1 hypothetical protein GCM10007389_40380 [Pontibacter akesuensis]SFU99303.1 hypothetical protein SAMN04487941_3943 [Pontibacter akesuensis]